MPGTNLRSGRTDSNAQPKSAQPFAPEAETTSSWSAFRASSYQPAVGEPGTWAISSESLAAGVRDAILKKLRASIAFLQEARYNGLSTNQSENQFAPTSGRIQPLTSEIFGRELERSLVKQRRYVWGPRGQLGSAGP